MKHRHVGIDADHQQAATLAKAVAAYAHAAFPDGGSECAQVSREALLDTARACATHQGGELLLRKRQLGLLRAALRWFGTEYPDDEPTNVAALKTALGG